MAVGRALAVAVVGLRGHLVEVEADVSSGLPAFGLVGLPDASLLESRDRVRAACNNLYFHLPTGRITVNLSPAALPKAGTGFDLAVAVALLAAAGDAPAPTAGQYVHIGELSLDGRVRPVRGVLPAVLAAVRAGRCDVVVASRNRAEAELVPGARVHPVATVADVVELHGGNPCGRNADGTPRTARLVLPAVADLVGAAGPGGPGGTLRPPGPPPDLADVLGQAEARRALEVAAAGAHHLLLMGPPGAGKTLLAARLPGLLPDLDDAAAVEVTSVHSLAGTLDPAAGLMRRPPFVDPHHTASVASLVGGGSGLPVPGAASRAHRGVLFLDEAAEFEARVLDALRQPLEHGELTIHRAQGAERFPARFQLVLASNPCPCGMATGDGLSCVCPATVRRRYLARLSGPLLDRVDVQVDVAGVTRLDLESGGSPEPTSVVAARVGAARAAQTARLAGTPWRCNGEVSGAWLRGPLRLPAAVTRELDQALDASRLTVRGYDRVLRVAWTVADLAGRDSPGHDEVGLALMLRQRGRTS
ncbi:YifB family Mg chelatase-like AAA ATPase [Spongisporangium articulatum]|uniref:YifB family Mg chelatase-like AAA ATPase n=1 Tax=Spongisporangium articulatum TaxID=3362603 RepID=A0ABW8AMZ6_9ACTN